MKPELTALSVRYIKMSELKSLLDREFPSQWKVQVSLKIFMIGYIPAPAPVPKSHLTQVMGDYLEVSAPRKLTQVRNNSNHLNHADDWRD